jgi:hypothetical protein
MIPMLVVAGLALLAAGYCIGQWHAAHVELERERKRIARWNA